MTSPIDSGARASLSASAQSARGVVRSVMAMSVTIGALHVLGWGTLVGVVVPEHISVGGKTFGIGLGLTAYVLGMRHAFDADHIAAVDNTTRMLIAEGKRPLSVGFWFSLGHSSVVFALSCLLIFGVASLVGPLSDSDSELHKFTGLAGTLVSSSFLYLIAAFNIIALIGIMKAFRSKDAQDDGKLEQQLRSRGLVGRLLSHRHFFANKPSQMFLVGLLFGLGFDTATEISLLVMTGAGTAYGLPWYGLLCLPVLFAAGMSLLDTLDGATMCYVYGWAYTDPRRRLYYNFVVTGLSCVVALAIGTIEILDLVSQRFSLSGGFWKQLSGIDLNTVGFGIVGLLIMVWIAASALLRQGQSKAEQAAAPDVNEV